MVRYALASNESATVLRNEHIVFNSYASKVLVGLKQVKVDELLAVAAGLPVVYKCRNEVDTRLVSHHEALLQTTSHAQTVGTKLFEVRSRLLVEAHVYLVQVLHVVNVHSHHVSKTVRQEHGVCSGAYSLFRVALHQSQLFQSVSHELAHGKVNIHISHARLSHLQCVVVTCLHNAVDLELSLRELAAHRHGARVVGAVVVYRLSTCVTQREASGLQHCHRRVAVHDLAVLAEDCGEAHHRTIRVCDAVDLSADKLLCHAGLCQSHRRGVHHVADLGSTLKLLYLLRLLR